jgi:hypothetical protein
MSATTLTDGSRGYLQTMLPELLNQVLDFVTEEPVPEISERPVKDRSFWSIGRASLLNLALTNKVSIAEGWL